MLLFGDPAQLPPVSNTNIFNTKICLNSFSVIQLKEPVKAKDPNLSAALLKITEGIIDVEITSVDLTHTVIICSRCKEVDAINEIILMVLFMSMLLSTQTQRTTP